MLISKKLNKIKKPTHLSGFFYYNILKLVFNYCFDYDKNIFSKINSR